MAIAAALALSLPGGSAARQPLAPEGGSRGAAAGAEIPADRTNACVKCHSSCEDGRVHEGLPPVVHAPDPALPLGADGRPECTTCHAPHEGEAAGGGARLRISNLRRELCLACHREAPGGGPRLRVVSPPERSVVFEERLALIGRASGLSGDYLVVGLNGVRFHLPVRGGEVLSWLTLRDGVNRIEVLEGDRPLWEGEVFLGAGAPGFYPRTTSAHQTRSRQECLACHRAAGEALATDGDGGALCYGCHARFEGKRFQHGPTAVGACLACHDPHGGFGEAHLRHEESLLCADCHAAREVAAKPGCNAAGKACPECHDPHQSDSRYLLKGPKYTALPAAGASGPH